MEEYLLRTLYYKVKMRGPSGLQRVCCIHKAEAYPWNMVFREDWIEFAAHNKFKVGDKISFRFVNFHVDQVIAVDYC
jgi:hypothetical protein